MKDDHFESFAVRRAVAAKMLEAAGCEWADAGDEGLVCRCPGHGMHSTGSSAKEARVFLSGAPTVHCFHASCAGVRADFNRALRQEIWRAEHDGKSPVGWSPKRELPPVPTGEVKKAREFDATKALSFAAQWSGDEPDADWLRRRSPIDPRVVGADDFLRALYEPEDRVMVLTWYRSTGDFMWVHGGEESAGKVYRLAKDPGVKAVPAARLPKAGRGGVHFLINPLSGEWKRKRVVGEYGQKFGRKLASCVTRWRYVLLESDVLPRADWLRVVCQLRLRVAALIATGGKSVHALVRLPMDAPAEPEWRFYRDDLWARLGELGADPQAMMPTNSSRLPGCIRIPEGHEGSLTGLPRQELLYLDPAPELRAISTQQEVRV
jgi:hypothetical protein